MFQETKMFEDIFAWWRTTCPSCLMDNYLALSSARTYIIKQIFIESELIAGPYTGNSDEQSYEQRTYPIL